MATHMPEKTPGTLLPVSKGEAIFPSLRMVRGPLKARRLARVLFVIFLASPFALVLVPWQQSLVGKGRLIAYDPVERQQTLEAPIEGRIMAWHVQEGSQVRKGDRIVSLRDPDPNLTSRLADERRAVEDRLSRSQARVKSLRRQAASLTAAREEAIIAAGNRKDVAIRNLVAAKQMVTAAKANVKLAEFDYESLLPLKKEGLVAEIELQSKRRLKVEADAKQVAATQAELAGEYQVQAADAELKRVGNDTDAGIQAVRALEQAAEAEVAAAERDFAQIRVRQARQETQEVTAPIDGTVFRVLANTQDGGIFVKAGAPLAILVPDISAQAKRTVELFMDGNDLPTITEFIRQQERTSSDGVARVPVRLQFEGWPAVQIIGWPTLAVGTFGGVVKLVDATDDGKGKFRLLVEADPDEEIYNPWPAGFSLRQGVRAHGWVLLNEVSLGWEMWRQLNAFPPVTPADEVPAKERKKLKVGV